MLPLYAYWKFDDFSWGDTRKTAGDTKKNTHGDVEGEFDSSRITMKKWVDFEQERRLRGPNWSRRDEEEKKPLVPPSAWTGRHSKAYRESYHD